MDRLPLLSLVAASRPAERPLLPGAEGEELEARLAALHGECRRAWPDLELAPAQFLGHVAARLPADAPLAEGLAALRGPDLYLACACAASVPGAVLAFERSVLPQVPASVSHLDPSPSFADDVLQALREKLLVAPPGATPKIGDYAGTGALLSWVRIAALRVALDLRRSASAQRLDSSEPDADVAERALPVQQDPEMDYIKERYRGEFRTAFRDAFQGLKPEQRNLLRLHYVDGLNIDRIGAMFHVHRSTIARWLSAACAQILDETRRLLRQRLRLSPAEFDSLAEVVRSQLDLNIQSCLREPTPSGLG